LLFIGLDTSIIIIVRKCITGAVKKHETILGAAHAHHKLGVG